MSGLRSCAGPSVDGYSGEECECEVSPTDACVSRLGPQLFGDPLRPFGGDAQLEEADVCRWTLDN